VVRGIVLKIQAREQSGRRFSVERNVKTYKSQYESLLVVTDSFTHTIAKSNSLQNIRVQRFDLRD
jgi:hypothetical protein